MKNWKIPTKNPIVSKYIDCYWFLEKKTGDISPDYPKLNPDPAGHLILAKPAQKYNYQLESEVMAGYGSHLILPNSKMMTLDHAQPFLILGVKFRVGALYAFKHPALPSSLVDQVIRISLEKLFLVTEFNLEKLLTQHTENPELCRDILDKQLSAYLSEIHEDRHSLVVRNILATFLETPLSEIGAKLNLSQRTIERSFFRVTGFTLKQYSSIEKLEKMLDYLHKREVSEIDWSEITFKFGFSDQPHLIRYLKSSIGKTPTDYVQNRDLAIDAYGNFE
jgi:AraC-like DNA-binding protein